MSTGVDNLVKIARSYAPCSIMKERVRYLELIAPIESPAMRNAMLGMSGCGLVARGFWRLAGVQHKRLSSPYVIGNAVADIVAIAHDFNAWVPCRPDLLQLPVPGDVVLIGGNGHGWEHILTVVNVHTTDPFTFDLVQGGTPDINSQTVTWHVANGMVMHGNRPVQGWASAEALGLPDTTSVWCPPEV